MAPSKPPDDPKLSEAIRCQRDLYLYWRLVAQAGSAPLTTRGYVARPLWRRLREQFERLPPQGAQAAPNTFPPDGVPVGPADPDERDCPRLLFLRRLLERLGLLRANDDPRRLVAAEWEVMARYLRLSLAERLRLCARLWAAAAWWPDTPGMRIIPAQSSLKAPAPQRVLALRRQLLTALASHEPGESLLLLDDMGAASHGRGRIPTRPRSHVANARSQRRQAPIHPDRRATDDDGAIIRAACAGPLSWLGFVVEQDETDDVSRTPVVNAAAWALRQEYRPDLVSAALAESSGKGTLREEPGRVVVLADLTIIAYPPLTAPALFTLDTCAVPLARDQTARYQVTREALANAQKTGWNTAEVVTRLESLTGAALPANVRVTLADWERQGGRLQLMPNVTLLEARDPAVIDTLLADATAHAWIERRLSPTVALLTGEGASLVRGWLLRHS